MTGEEVQGRCDLDLEPTLEDVRTVGQCQHTCSRSSLLRVEQRRPLLKWFTWKTDIICFASCRRSSAICLLCAGTLHVSPW